MAGIDGARAAHAAINMLAAISWMMEWLVFNRMAATEHLRARRRNAPAGGRAIDSRTTGEHIVWLDHRPHENDEETAEQRNARRWTRHDHAPGQPHTDASIKISPPPAGHAVSSATTDVQVVRV